MAETFSMELLVIGHRASRRNGCTTPPKVTAMKKWANWIEPALALVVIVAMAFALWAMIQHSFSEEDPCRGLPSAPASSPSRS
jgi:hypothetical protein